MFQRPLNRKTLGQVLTGLVCIAMWSNAVVWVFCPHMTGSLSHCSPEYADVPSHKSLNDPLTGNTHCTGKNAADMDNTHDVAMNMSDTDMEQITVENVTTSELDTLDLLRSELINLARLHPVNSEAITQSTQPCPHCMMHSNSGPNSSGRAVVLNSSSYVNLTVAFSLAAVTAPPSPSTLDVHDHGPPGLNNSRYVLNNSLRI